MTRPRVAILLHNLRAGGAERSMATLANGLAGSGLDVDLLLVSREGPLLAEISADVRIIDLNRRRTMYSIPAVIRYLRRQRPNALLSALVHVNVAAVLAGKLAFAGTRVVISERGHTEFLAVFDRHRRARIASRLARWLYPLADEIVAVSAGVAGSVARFCHVPLERIHTMPGPIAIPPDLGEAVREIDHPWIVGEGPPIILAVGRLAPEKDFESLVRAFALIRKQRTARLLILGEGPCRARIESLCADLGVSNDVSLPGFMRNPFGWMSRAAVLVLSSLSEGFPRVLVEAMACGTPVVATDCPSGPREILDSGLYGELVPVRDAIALSNAISRTLDTTPDRNRLKRRAADFSVDRTIAAYSVVLLG